MFPNNQLALTKELGYAFLPCNMDVLDAALDIFLHEYEPLKVNTLLITCINVGIFWMVLTCSEAALMI